MSNKYIPWEVYKNLDEFIKWRNISDTSEKIIESKFSNLFHHFGYAQITGTRDDKHGKRNVFIVLIAPGNPYSTKLPSFKQLMKQIPSGEKNNNAEIVIISEQPLTNFIMKHIDELRRAHPGWYLEHYTYTCFSTIIPDHVLVPLHSIPTDEEIDIFCKLNHEAPENFTKIYASDPPVVWLGLRPGDIVKVARKSYNIGETVVYKHVIAGGF